MPFLIVAVILIAIYFAFLNISEISDAVTGFISIISPLLIGILISYFLYVPHRAIEKLLKKVKIKNFTFISRSARGISTLIILLLLILIIALVMAYLVPTIVSNVVDLAMNIPRYVQTLSRDIDNLLKNTPFEGFNTSDLLRENTSTLINMLISSGNVEQAARGVLSFAGGVLNTVLAIAISMYILWYRDDIKEYFTRLNNAVFKNHRRRDAVARYLKQINKVLLTFIASKGVDALINFTAATTIMLIFRVPYALLMGLVAGLFNFIPYIGSIVSSLLISILALITRDLPVAIGVAVSVFAFQQLDGNYIEPRIFKTSLKVNPILVIMAVVIGGAYMNIPGMFLGVPIAVIIKQLLHEYMSSREALPGADDVPD